MMQPHVEAWLLRAAAGWLRCLFCAAVGVGRCPVQSALEDGCPAGCLAGAVGDHDLVPPRVPRGHGVLEQMERAMLHLFGMRVPAAPLMLAPPADAERGDASVLQHMQWLANS
jgi:hypothetical protein